MPDFFMPKNGRNPTKSDIFPMAKCVQFFDSVFRIFGYTGGLMRIGLLIKDAEYRGALAERLSSFDNDLFVNIIDGSNKDNSRCLILTDILPREIDPGVLKAIKARTVFLKCSDTDVPDGYFSVFKYSSASSLVSELSDVYNSWCGCVQGRHHVSKLIAVCTESDFSAAINCMQLARQIIYRYGGRVLVLPLSYINDYGRKEYSEKNDLQRLLYSIRSGRIMQPDSYTYTDSYGTYFLHLSPGINPVAYLSDEELGLLLKEFCTGFDAVICDIGTCFRTENLQVIHSADYFISFGYGRRELDIGSISGSEGSDRTIRIKLSGTPEEAAELDRCIQRIYGTEK